MSTIYEVAALAGVSPSTVSRVYNGVSVSEAKVRKVKEAAAQLNFAPNRTARRLRRQSSEVIALVIPDIENPYYTELARGVEDAAQKAGYSIVLCNTDDRTSKEVTYLGIAMLEDMAGVILAAASNQPDLDGLIARRIPIVAVDRGTKYPIDTVVMANKSAGRMATQLLHDAGYRRIACISGPRSVETATERVSGWREVLEAQGAPPEDDYLRVSDFRVDGGRRAMEELLALPEPPDAVVAGNNLIGVGALQVMSEHGLMPPDVGVAVIGGLPFTTLSPNLISVVRLPARNMGMAAAQMLIERIDGDRQPPRTMILESEIRPASTPASK